MNKEPTASKMHRFSAVLLSLSGSIFILLGVFSEKVFLLPGLPFITAGILQAIATKAKT